MGRQVYLWHDEDLAWLREVHLEMMDAADRDKIKSAVIFGNEDCPDTIHLYDKAWPTVHDKPFAEYHHNQEGDVIILNGLQEGSR